MKNKKISLNQIKVTSFITSLTGNDQLTLKGGVTEDCGNTFEQCNSVPINNCNYPSYNATCPTLPVQDCQVPQTRVVGNLCFATTTLTRTTEYINI
jgi:hypothetical protein